MRTGWTGSMSGDGGIDRRPNLVLLAKRQERGWSRGRAARELYRLWREHFQSPPEVESLTKSIRRHEKGEVQVRDEIYRHLYCLAYDSSPQELFGALGVEWKAGHYRLVSHKFIPAYIGPQRAAQLVGDSTTRFTSNKWFDHHLVPIESASSATLHVWPFGVSLLHVVERLALQNLATMAVWRQRSYVENIEWATGQLRSMCGDHIPDTAYVFSLYWITHPAWSGPALNTALQIHAMPKVLLENREDCVVGKAELVERALLSDGFSHPDILSFGIPGVSIAYASWSAIAYHPITPGRALSVNESVDCQLAVQAIWSYCSYINGEIENGREPEISPDYGWRFLRAARSRLANARPQETGQHRSMRNAVLESSGIMSQLDHAIEALR